MHPISVFWWDRAPHASDPKDQVGTVVFVSGHDRVEPRLQIQKMLARKNSAVTMQILNWRRSGSDVKVLTALCAAYRNINSEWTATHDLAGRTADDAYALKLHVPGRQPCSFEKKMHTLSNI